MCKMKSKCTDLIQNKLSVDLMSASWSRALRVQCVLHMSSTAGNVTVLSASANICHLRQMSSRPAGSPSLKYSCRWEYLQWWFLGLDLDQDWVSTSFSVLSAKIWHTPIVLLLIITPPISFQPPNIHSRIHSLNRAHCEQSSAKKETVSRLWTDSLRRWFGKSWKRVWG